MGQKFLVTGFKYPGALERVFDSLLVDVAYVEESNEEFILAIPDDAKSTDQSYIRWVRETIELTLRKHGQDESVKVEIL